MPSPKQRNRRPQKVNVKDNSDFDATGYVQPRTITWRDSRSFKIDAVKDFRPSSMFTNKAGDCYTVIINGQEKTFSLNAQTLCLPAD